MPSKEVINIIHSQVRDSEWPYKYSIRSQEFVEQNCGGCAFFQAETKEMADFDTTNESMESRRNRWAKNSIVVECKYKIPVKDSYGFCYPINVVPPASKDQSVEHARRMRKAALEIEKVSYGPDPEKAWQIIEEQFKGGDMT